MKDFIADATHRLGLPPYTTGEKSIGTYFAQMPKELQMLLTELASQRLRDRQAGAHRLSTFLPGLSDGLKIKLTSGMTIKDSYFHGNKWTGITTDSMGPAIRDVLFDNFGIFGSWRWGSRFYRAAGVTARNMTISGVEEEHGWYVNISKTLDPSVPAIWWDKVLVENVGSQCGQFVYRPHETPDIVGDTDPNTGPLKFTECVFRNFHLTSQQMGSNGNTFQIGGKRPAQTLQFKATPNDVEIVRCLWDNSAVPLSYGALTVLGRSTEKDKLKNDGSLIDIDATHRKLSLTGSQMFLAPSQQKPIWCKDIDSVLIQDCHIETAGGKEPVIDIDSCKKVYISNCTGNVKVKIDGRVVGPITQDFKK